MTVTVGEVTGDTTEDTDVPVMRIESVSVVRDGRAILDRADLTVRPGEHWALLGANGAGKSTLVKVLGAQHHPTLGTARVLGRLLGRIDVRELRGLIGHVDPRHPLRSALRVQDVVLTGCTGSVERVPGWRPTAEQLERAGELLAMLGLDGRADARWPVLSQGERGKTLIARALMPAPRLLLLDEPATGLDLAAREQLLESIDDLRSARPELASVLVTHHLEELPASTTHALLLRDGRTVASGLVGDVLTGGLVSEAFRHPVTIERHDGRWRATARRRPPR